MRKVVVVAMLDSIHVARWLDQFAGEQIEFWLFPSSPMRRLHPQIKRMLNGRNRASFKIPAWTRLGSLPLWLLDRIFDNALRAFLLQRMVAKVEPSVVHLIELQNAGYIGLKAFSLLRERTFKIICTNYGSDIFWFQQSPRHLPKLQKLLSMCDSYAAECHRDVGLAIELGFAGEVKPIRPNAGGFSEKVLQSELPPESARTCLLLKGYHGWVGRAKIALKALQNIAPEIAGLEVVVFSADRSVAREARRVARHTGLTILVHRKGTLSHESMLKLHARAKVYVGLSLSDGISTSLLEAMAMGAIPVQTSTSCCDEWFTSTGVKVAELSVDGVGKAILHGLELAADPANRITNRKVIREKASAEYVKRAAHGFYL